MYSNFLVLKSSFGLGFFQMKTDEQERLIRELEGALQRSALEIDRKLTQQQREYEQKIQLLVHQLAQTGGTDTNPNSHDK